MNENRKKSNGRNSHQSREQLDKFLKDSEGFLQKEYMEHIRKRWADRMQEEYAAAPANYEPTDEEIEEHAKAVDELERNERRERKFNMFREFLKQGIKLKKDNPGSELFKIAKQLLELLDQAESDISSIGNYQLKRYTTLFSLYVQLLDSELTKQTVLKKPAETGQKVRSSFKKIIGWIFKKTSHFICAIFIAVIATIIAAIIVDILADFGWFERIKSFFTR